MAVARFRVIQRNLDCCLIEGAAVLEGCKVSFRFYVNDGSWAAKLRGVGKQHNGCDLPLAACTRVESTVGIKIPIIDPFFA
jgi:hypothetical protein